MTDPDVTARYQPTVAVPTPCAVDFCFVDENEEQAKSCDGLAFMLEIVLRQLRADLVPFSSPEYLSQHNWRKDVIETLVYSLKGEAQKCREQSAWLQTP